MSSPDHRSRAVVEAAAALQRGAPVCIFDGDDREGETDLFYPGTAATPEAIARLRQDAGGLVFVAYGHDARAKLGLPWLEDMIQLTTADDPALRDLVPKRLPYDTRSSFGLTINHRDAFTGITDEDRSLTVRALAELTLDLPGLEATAAKERFVATFRAPGHVALCYEAEAGLDARRGHTELAAALARMARVTPVIVGAEMLVSGCAMAKEDAMHYALQRGIPFVEGVEIVDAWTSLKAAGDLAALPA